MSNIDIDDRVILWDIETYPNIFTLGFLEYKTRNSIVFEISDRKDEWDDFLDFLEKCRFHEKIWVGFNNFYFDYQVTHPLIENPKYRSLSGINKSEKVFNIAQEVIRLQREGGDEKMERTVWAKKQIVRQMDLFLIHHFNNVNRFTSLKQLEFNMRSSSIKDLPYKVGSYLNDDQKDELIIYNKHDLSETLKLYEITKPKIDFRNRITGKIQKDCTNYSDVKIGEELYLRYLNQKKIDTHRKENGIRVPIQTIRPSVKIKDVIMPCIKFERPEFNAVKGWLEKQVIRETKAVFTQIDIDEDDPLRKYTNLKKKKGKIKNLNCIIDGFQYDIGTGGIHGSIESSTVESDEDNAIIDYDVTSMYGSLAIENKIYPEHLTEAFCEVGREIRTERTSYKKGTPENNALKLSLNGVYGKSNDKFSPFFDPLYTMKTTVNGQLMLCMLAEKYLSLPEESGIKIIQVNTDGITIRVARKFIPEIEKINDEWSKITKLNLERVDYKTMYIRDVNNYIAQDIDLNIKRKGAYQYEVDWHQNHSHLIIPKAAEKFLIEKIPIEEYIMSVKDVYDFMIITNVPRSSKLVMDKNRYGGSEELDYEYLQNLTRYFMSKDVPGSGKFYKIMPPLEKTKTKQEKLDAAKYPKMKRNIEEEYKWREALGIEDRKRIIGIQKDENVMVANTINKQDHEEILKNINYKWYIDETIKLVQPLLPDW